MLSDVWRDIISIGGFALTFAGLLYTMRQVWLAKTAAEAARTAATKTLIEARTNFEKYVASNAHRFIHEAKAHIEAAQWALAALRLNDLADQLAQLGLFRPALWEFVSAVRERAGLRSRLASGELPVFNTRKWLAFSVTLQSAIDAVHGPYAT